MNLFHNQGLIASAFNIVHEFVSKELPSLHHVEYLDKAPKHLLGHN